MVGCMTNFVLGLIYQRLCRDSTRSSAWKIRLQVSCWCRLANRCPACRCVQIVSCLYRIDVLNLDTARCVEFGCRLRLSVGSNRDLHVLKYCFGRRVCSSAVSSQYVSYIGSVLLLQTTVSDCIGGTICAVAACIAP